MNTRNERRAKIRKTIKGTVSRPRLVVFRSNRYFYAQAIDDAKGYTLVSVNKAANIDIASKEFLEKAGKAKIKELVFDRSGYKYHGMVKKFAESLRQGGLKI